MKSVQFILLFIAFLFVVCEAGTLFKVFPQITPLYRGRADPIVSPGQISGHVHRVFGGSAFSLGTAGRSNVDVYNDMMASKCTTASITVDKSAYWTPDLYYRYPNGTFTLVPIGGLTVYYFGRGGTGSQANSNFTAFPPGFRMIAGNPFRRTYSGTVPEQATTFLCIGANKGDWNGFPTDTQKCTGGLRAQVFFPMCWDGVRLDTPNHKDHVAYPTNYNGGNCPDTHPKRLPGVFLEILYSVDQDKFPHGDGVNPFVLAMGDPTGHGLHGDFLNGWDVDILQRAMDHPSCDSTNTNNGNIPQNCLPLQPYIKNPVRDEECRLDNPIVNYEDIGINHWIDHLPGNNPIVYGPANAVPLSGSYAQTISPHVKRVLFKSLRNNLFVSAYAARGDTPVVADTPENKLSYPQVFDIIDFGGGSFGISSESKPAWWSNNGGGSPVTADRGSSNANSWERFRIDYTGGSGPTQAGTVGSIFALGNSRYITVNANGQLIANSATISGVNEQFLVIDANAGVPDTRPGATTGSGTTGTTSGTTSGTTTGTTQPPTSAPTPAPTTKPTTAPTASPTSRPPTAGPTSAPPTAGPTSPPSSTPPAVAFIQNKATGRFVVLGANNLLLASESSSASANVFLFSAVSGGHSIKARTNNLIVAANDGGASAISARSYTVSSWETFVISSPSSGFFALRAVNGKYVTAQSGNTLVPTTDVPVGSSIPDAALFRLVAPSLPALTSVSSISANILVKLYSKSTLTYISVDGYGNLQTLGDNHSLGATFRLTASGSGFSLFNTATSKYTTADGGGSGPLMANRDSASGWETFFFAARSGGFYTITASANSQLVAAQNNDWFQLSPSVPASSSPPDTALFYVVAA